MYWKLKESVQIVYLVYDFNILRKHYVILTKFSVIKASLCQSFIIHIGV